MANAGDEALGRELMTHGRAAWRVALAVLRDASAAEDAVQEAYARVWDARGSIRREVSVRAYLLRAVANTAREIARTENRRRAREDRAGREGRMPLARRLDAELASRLERSLASLDEGTRLAVELHYGEGLSHAEVASVLELEPAAARKRASRGLARLRELLAGAGLALAPGALSGALGTASPGVPAALGARLGRIVLDGTRVAGAGTAAAKGGIAMKLIAGVVLAAIVAAGVATLSGGGGDLSAAAPPTGRKDAPHGQKYEMALTVCDEQKILDGPVEGAECVDVIKGLDLDDAGNWYWAESAYAALRTFRKKTGRVYTVAGSTACGLLDGPLEAARFGGWSYNSTNLISASSDGRHVFVRDNKIGRIWRHIDLEAGMVRSLPPYQQKGKMHLIIVRDKSGEIYAFYSSGQDAPDCPGYKKLKVAPFKTKDHYIGSPDDWAIDAENMKFYWHSRGDIQVCNLKTGEIKNLTPGDGHKCASGPFEGMAFWCPTGMSISPGGRYVYVGGGDSSTCWRLDLEKKHIDRWARGEDKLWSFGEGKHTDKGCRGVMGSNCWPAAVLFGPDGHGAWPTCHGIYRLTPAN